MRSTEQVNDDVNQAIRKQHGLQTHDTKNQKQVFQVCGQKNDADRIEELIERSGAASLSTQ